MAFTKDDDKLIDDSVKASREGKRKLFSIKFVQLLEASFTILKIQDSKIDVGSAKVLVQDMGPGGLCFISNLNLPIQKDVILQFTTELIGEEIKICGYPTRKDKIDDNLHTYGVEFIIDENERADLIRILNQVQIKMKNNMLFDSGNFISKRPTLYFKSQTA